MIRKKNILMLLLVTMMVTTMGCQKNYYSGKAKSSDCGCPQKKGMVGY